MTTTNQIIQIKKNTHTSTNSLQTSRKNLVAEFINAWLKRRRAAHYGTSSEICGRKTSHAYSTSIRPAQPLQTINSSLCFTFNVWRSWRTPVYSGNVLIRASSGGGSVRRRRFRRRPRSFDINWPTGLLFLP